MSTEDLDIRLPACVGGCGAAVSGCCLACWERAQKALRKFADPANWGATHGPWETFWCPGEVGLSIAQRALPCTPAPSAVAAPAELKTLRARAEAAERHRDIWQEQARTEAQARHRAQERVAELEAALREVRERHPRSAQDVTALIDAALSPAPAAPTCARGIHPHGGCDCPSDFIAAPPEPPACSPDDDTFPYRGTMGRGAKPAADLRAQVAQEWIRALLDEALVHLRDDPYNPPRTSEAELAAAREAGRRESQPLQQAVDRFLTVWENESSAILEPDSVVHAVEELARIRALELEVP